MSNVKTYTLTPRDVLFFRDARPMDVLKKGENEFRSIGHGANWPRPDILHSAVMHELIRNPESPEEEWYGTVPSLKVMGPFPHKDGKLYLPMPLDWDMMLCQMPKVEEGMTDLPKPLTCAFLDRCEGKKKYPEWKVLPEIMIPLVGELKELKFVKDVVVATANAEIAAAGVELEYKVGTMIESPRAALTADEIAKEAEFFSFGTNDLTQMTFGFSRDDAGKFLPSYYDTKIYENDPFARLDQNGVGKLVKMAAELGKATRPDIKLGICGEHGGDPTSVEFCHKIGLTYVSCSPFRVPIARLSAAQAAIKESK